MQKVKLNIVPKGVKKTTYLSQNDNGRVVRYELFNELIPYILDGSETITLKVVRPDGVEILANIENTFEGEAYIDVNFTDVMSAITGVGAGEIKITDGETELGSHNFDINVEIDAYNGKDVVIETETGTLLSFNTEVEDNALEYESEIPYNAAGYTGLRVINTRTAPVYDKTPYLFRKTPSGYGNSCIEKLTGLSVAFNQLVENGNFVSASGWNKIGDNASFSVSNNELTFVGSNDALASVYRPVNATKGHKLIYFIDIKGDDNYSNWLFTFGGAETYVLPITNVWSKYIKIVSKFSDSYNLNIIRKNESTAGEIVHVKNVQLIDLTQMFGSTIADYIYSLETAQAGAGVAYFKNLFGADYYPFNAGELMSVKTSGRKTVGKNQFNVNNYYEKAYNVEVSNDGTLIFVNNYYATIRYQIKLPSKNINFTISFDLEFSGGKGFLGITDQNNVNIYESTFNNGKITVTFNTGAAEFIRLAFCGNNNAANGTMKNIMLEFGSEATAYEPYNAVTYPLDPDLELRGIPKLDANNKLYGDGDIYESSGDVTRRYGIVDLGSLSWVYSNASGHERFYVGVNGIETVSQNEIANILCAKYTTDTVSNIYIHSKDKTIGAHYEQEQIWIYDSAYTDAATFKASLDGVYLIYEKATPTSESADPFTDPQEARITEEFIDGRAVEIPVGQDSIYGTDIEYQDIDFNTTIYGGEIDAVNGVLSSEYNSDGSVKPTPEIIDITPTPIPVKAGDNKIFNSANGNQTIRYYNQVEE